MTTPKAITGDEVRELLSATLHGELPEATVRRMIATLALWLDKRDRQPRLRRIRVVSDDTAFLALQNDPIDREHEEASQRFSEQAGSIFAEVASHEEP